MPRRVGGTAMNNRSPGLDRRQVLGATALTLMAASSAAHAQQEKPTVADTAKPTQRVAEFVAGFELKQAPALAIERARTAFIDTVGVMLAGKRSEPAALLLGGGEAEGAGASVRGGGAGA